MTWQLLILEQELLIILRWPLKCSQVTGKNIKGRNPKVQFFGTPCSSWCNHPSPHHSSSLLCFLLTCSSNELQDRVLPHSLHLQVVSKCTLLMCILRPTSLIILSHIRHFFNAIMHLCKNPILTCSSEMNKNRYCSCTRMKYANTWITPLLLLLIKEAQVLNRKL